MLGLSARSVGRFWFIYQMRMRARLLYDVYGGRYLRHFVRANTEHRFLEVFIPSKPNQWYCKCIALFTLCRYCYLFILNLSSLLVRMRIVRRRLREAFDWMSVLGLFRSNEKIWDQQRKQPGNSWLNLTAHTWRSCMNSAQRTQDRQLSMILLRYH